MKIWCNRRRRRDRDSLRGRRSGGVERDPESAWSSRPRTKRLALASPFPCPATAAPPRRSKQAGGHDFGRRGCHTEVSCMTVVQMRMLDPTRSIHVRIAALRHDPPPNALLAVGEGFRALASSTITSNLPPTHTHKGANTQSNRRLHYRLPRRFRTTKKRKTKGKNLKPKSRREAWENINLPFLRTKGRGGGQESKRGTVGESGVDEEISNATVSPPMMDLCY
ncbi:hypothetical protein B296_00027746 [Ensete ventricosum]|uniref:Uncharacterized protein n=1 Tax=Ensete ventricosum TaxID=4639 RepID=A0A426YDK5_ENSVE|nr:hypothetical protein B296_00027746 [Ensete ventricosum]